MGITSSSNGRKHNNHQPHQKVLKSIAGSSTNIIGTPSLAVAQQHHYHRTHQQQQQPAVDHHAVKSHHHTEHGGYPDKFFSKPSGDLRRRLLFGNKHARQENVFFLANQTEMQYHVQPHVNRFLEQKLSRSVDDLTRSVRTPVMQSKLKTLCAKRSHSLQKIELTELPKKLFQNHPIIPGQHHAHNQSSANLHQRSNKVYTCETTPTALVHIRKNRLELQSEIGGGHFGIVYRARLDKKLDVAVKTLKDCSTSRGGTRVTPELLKEADIMTTLDHPNLLKIIGVTFLNNTLAIVMDYMRNGALNNYFQRNKDVFLKLERKTVNERLNSFAKQVYDAMAYLEQKMIVHRDLAARNCLVGADEQVKVGDFGLARFTECGSYSSKPQSLCAVRWASPEALTKRLFSSKSDVWSYGVLLWEIYSLGDVPYGKTVNNQFVRKCVTSSSTHSSGKNQLLPRPIFGTRYIYDELILRCLTKDALSRPTFADLKTYIQTYIIAQK